MIQYNPKNWFSLIFQFHRSDTFRKLFWLILSIGVYTALIVLFEKHVFSIKSTNVIHSLLGFILSLLLVFRTNTAYDRWWDGRRLLGNLVNSFRSFTHKIDTFLTLKEEKLETFSYIQNFTISFEAHLSGNHNHEKMNKTTHLNEHLEKSMHIPNLTANELYHFVERKRKDGTLNDIQFLALDADLKEIVATIGGCERIKNTPIPYSYSMFIKKFIFVYIMTLPIFLAQDFGFVLIPLTMFVFYALVSIEMLAEEIEDPFNGDVNDLPLKEICINIQTNSKETLNK